MIRSDISAARAGGGKVFLLVLLLTAMAVIYLAIIDSVGWSGKVAMWLIGVTAFVIIVVWRWALQGKPILPKIRIRSGRLRVDNKALIALVIIALVVLGIVFRSAISETMVTWAEESAKAISTLIIFMVVFAVLGIVIAIYAGGGANPQIIFIGAAAGAVLGLIVGALLVNFNVSFSLFGGGGSGPWWWPF